MDERMEKLLDLILEEDGSIDCEDKRLDAYSDDRGEQETDTINLLINAGWIVQKGEADWGENFRLEIAEH